MKRRLWGEGQEQMLPDLKKRFGEGWWRGSNRGGGGRENRKKNKGIVEIGGSALEKP